MKKALGSAIDNDSINSFVWIMKKPGMVDINRPRVHNAMNSDCILEMTMALETLEPDPFIRVIAIIGSGEKRSLQARIYRKSRNSPVSRWSPTTGVG